MQRQRRLSEIDALKSAAILTVVFIHSLRASWDPGFTYAERLLSETARFAVPAFLAVSGFLYYSDEPVGGAVLARRLRRILVPYLFVSLAAYGFVRAYPQWAATDSFWTGLLVGATFGPYYYVFLLTEFVLATYLLSRMPRAWTLPVFAISCVAALAPFLWFREGVRVTLWTLRLPLLFSCWFMLGWTAAAYEKRTWELTEKRRGAIFAMWFGFDWQSNSRREVLLMPHMMALDEDDQSATAGELIPEPYSVRFAGVWLSSIMEYGYHHSPSNRPVVVDDAAQEILYIPGDPSGDTQLLRGAGIVSCEEGWGKGVHTSGNRSAAFPTDTDMRNALHAQFIEDMLDEAILFYLDQWKDRNASPAAFDHQEDRINAFFGTKMTGNDPAIYGGRFWFDREATTPERVADNWFRYSYDFMPVAVFERMTVTRWINIEYARDALQLAQAPDAPAGAAA